MGSTVAVALALAGVAFLPAGQIPAVPLDGSVVLLAAVCVPPGVPPFSSWRAIRAEPVVALDDRERPVLAVFGAYLAQGVRIHAIWVDSLLASVDNAVDRKDEPAWYDRGVTAVSSAIRTDRRQACDWFKPPARPQHNT